MESIALPMRGRRRDPNETSVLGTPYVWKPSVPGWRELGWPSLLIAQRDLTERQGWSERLAPFVQQLRSSYLR